LRQVFAEEDNVRSDDAGQAVGALWDAVVAIFKISLLTAYFFVQYVGSACIEKLVTMSINSATTLSIMAEHCYADFPI
jgi:hypothetical protein